LRFRKHWHHNHHRHHHRFRCHNNTKLIIFLFIIILIIIFGAILFSNIDTSESVIDSSQFITQTEQAIFKYTNEERIAQGVSPLKIDNKLSDIARMHSEDMVTNNFFDHINLKGEDSTARAQRVGYNVTKPLGGESYQIGIGENIGQMPTGNVEGMGYISNNSDSIARAQVDSWMNSPGHRANILDPQYNVIGVGVAYDGHLYYISTQDFK